jgi:hypothetical protein
MSRMLVAAALLLVPTALSGQEPVRRPPPADDGRRPAVRQPVPPRPGQPQQAVDTTAAVSWVPADTTMERLLSLEDYVVTRYQGAVVSFDAVTRVLELLALDARVAAVQRDAQLVVADTSVIYNELTGEAVAVGNVLFRDPARGADVVGRGARYNLRERSAIVRGGRTAVEMGEQWFVSADVFKTVLPDTAGQSPRFYGVRGSLTSCTDTTHGPHYHFHFKEIKRTSRNMLVARPPVLYIADVPVMWLPFVFQDTRTGRRSGMLPPTFGVMDIVRNSPNYRRRIENVGYYWAISDYMDFETSLDWRSGARGTSLDPGWTRYNAEWRYRWLDRFLEGRLGSSYTSQRDGNTNLGVSWTHRQEFSRSSSLNANLNYVTSTRLQRQNSVDPYAVMATISSQLNYQQRIGPASMSVGGTRRQYPGRDQIEQTLPTLSITTATLNLAPWLAWTPNFQVSESRVLNIDQPGPFAWRYRTSPDGSIRDSVRTDRNSRVTSGSFSSPIQIFGFDLQNNFRFVDEELNFPQEFRVYDVNDTTFEQRIFARTFRSEVDWNSSFSLPGLARSSWNISPRLSFENVDPRPFAVRTHLSGGRFVTQTKRPVVGVSVTPTFFGLWPGFGPYSRIRHAITPSIGYSWAPSASVSDEYLRAINQQRSRYLGALQQSQVSLALNQNIEARLATSDTSSTSQDGTKVKLLSLSLTPISYDFERARATGSAIRGLTNSHFGYSARSDLLPGVDLQVDYSLFEGDAISDSARFSPYRTRVSAGFSINQTRNPFVIFNRLLGRPVQATTPSSAEMEMPEADSLARRLSVQPVAGSRARSARFVVPAGGQGWDASFTFSSSRQRPPIGGSVVDFDPTIQCEVYRNVNPFQYEACVAQTRANPGTQTPITSGTIGGPMFRFPPTTTLGINTRFPLTPRWAASWNTMYDFVANDFASHMVSLQRDLHDWRAIFAFTQSPNGNFAFNFFISLKAEPELKFDYSRTSYRSDGQR